MIDLTAQTESPALKKLREREAKLKEQIKQVQKVEAEKEKAIQARKCQLIGEAILEEMKTNTELAGQVGTILSVHTKDSNNRKLLGLPALKKTDTNRDVSQAQQTSVQQHS